MTTSPKEKAKELVEKFRKLFIDASADKWSEPAKESALIAVDEIINEYKKLEKQFNGGFNQLNYWKDVKIAIKLL